MPLTDAAIRALKPGEKTQKKYDAAGLFLEVTPSGSKRWRFRYALGGKQRLISMGIYPQVSLKGAREQRDEAGRLLSRGIDPSAERQARKASATDTAGTLEAIAREWLTEKHAHEVVPSHAERNKRRLELHVFPRLGRRPIAAIEPPEILQVLQTIVKTGRIETAHRVRNLLSQVWRYAIANKRASRDMAADLKDSLRAAPTRHQPAITDVDGVAGLLRAIEGYAGFPPTVAALKLSALLFVRPGELRRMEWSAVNLDAATWDYQPSKGGRPMVTPLPDQATATLRELHSLTGRDRYVFPSARGRGRPMSENTVNGALHRLGFKDVMTAHGFRAMARTILEERLGFPEGPIEMQLGHGVKGPNGRAYNRVTWLDERRAMLQAWADFLDQLRDDNSNVVPIGTQRA